MSFLHPVADPLDRVREEVERAHAHLDHVRERVEAGDLDGRVLTMAELRVKHAQDRWTDAVRGESPPTGGAA